MIMTNKLLPVALVAALIGGSVGAVVMHSRSQPATTQSTSSMMPTTDAQYQANVAGNEQFTPVQFNSAAEQSAYKSGFADGFRACESGASGTQLSSTTYQSAQPRVVYRNSGRSYAHSPSSSGSVTTVASQPRGRSFWQKHRDKLTVAMGTGGGAILGGLIGGKKGAAIGALSGAGGSALYTYKLRNRNRRY